MDLKQKLTQLNGLVGTSALNTYETKFVKDVQERVVVAGKAGTTVLTGPQVELIERVFDERCR